MIEPPDPRYEYSEGEGVWIDAGDASEECNADAPKPLIPLPSGGFAHWFFVRDWNAFIHVAARKATLRRAGGRG